MPSDCCTVADQRGRAVVVGRVDPVLALAPGDGHEQVAGDRHDPALRRPRCGGRASCPSGCRRPRAGCRCRRGGSSCRPGAPDSSVADRDLLDLVELAGGVEVAADERRPAEHDAVPSDAEGDAPPPARPAVVGAGAGRRARAGRSGGARAARRRRRGGRRPRTRGAGSSRSAPEREGHRADADLVAVGQADRRWSGRPGCRCAGCRCSSPRR